MPACKCPITGCWTAVTPTQIMCEDHWSYVPKKLRDPIRAQKHDRTSPAWKAAVQAAVDHVMAEKQDQDAIEDYVSRMGASDMAYGPELHATSRRR